MLIYFYILSCFLAFPTATQTISTNSLQVHSPPTWLRRTQVEKVSDRIENKLEWTIRRTDIYWYQDQKLFEKEHRLGPLASAVTFSSKTTQKILMGPKVTPENFEEILGHELVHLIFAQKYHGSIPKWLEEGFANHLSRKRKVDYTWLKRQKLPEDVNHLSHPLTKSPEEAQVAYAVSQALVEMLAKKCDLENLIRLSVQKKMTDYIETYCEIKDLNQAFKKWMDSKPLV